MIKKSTEFQTNGQPMNLQEVTSKQYGILGEELAGCCLKKHGYKILFRNYKCPLGEIDFIAKQEDTLVFIEVKARRSEHMGAPEESVSYFKRRKIVKSASYFLNHYQIKDIPCRFDVVSVFKVPQWGMDIEIIQDAFDENGR